MLSASKMDACKSETPQMISKKEMPSYVFWRWCCECASENESLFDKKRKRKLQGTGENVKKTDGLPKIEM